MTVRRKLAMNNLRPVSIPQRVSMRLKFILAAGMATALAGLMFFSEDQDDIAASCAEIAIAAAAACILARWMMAGFQRLHSDHFDLIQ